MKLRMIRSVTLILAISVLAMCFPLTAFAAYENTHVNTGDQAYDIVKVAETQVGYLEGSLSGTTAGSNNYTKYGVWYDNYFNSSGFSYGAWCAMFVSWCAYQADIPSSTMYYHAYCPYGVDWFEDRGLWQDSAYYGGNYAPQPGDIIYFGDSSGSSHVGLVRYSSGGYVYTIEGNTSGQNGEINEGGGCFAKTYTLGYSRILGYGTPNYETGTGTTAEKLGTYSITASSLNVRSGAATSYDIVGSVEKGDLVVVTELYNGWGKVTLADGTTGWCSISDYGDYIGVDALNTNVAAVWYQESVDITTNSNGSVTLTNNHASEYVAVDLPLINPIGNRTTPYLNVSVSRHKGGWYFGLTQTGSGYFMMRECQSGDELVVASSANYMQTDEQLQIDVGYWWAPEEKWQIDCVRFYLQAGSSITVNYCYFAEEANVVTSDAYNMRNGAGSAVVADPLNLLVPNTLSVVDRSKNGGYTYANGTLTVVSNEANGYEVSTEVNKTFKPEELCRWLISVEANVRFDMELLVTTADGDRTFSLADDFYNEFHDTPDGEYIPAVSRSAGLDFLGCYTWNGILPADGNSTVKTVTFRVGGVGSLKVNGCQLATNDSLTLFTDSITKSDSTPDQTTDSDVVKGDVNADGSITTVDARMILTSLLNGVNLTEQQSAAADYDGDGTVSTMDVRVLLKVLLG